MPLFSTRGHVTMRHLGQINQLGPQTYKLYRNPLAVCWSYFMFINHKYFSIHREKDISQATLDHLGNYCCRYGGVATT